MSVVKALGLVDEQVIALMMRRWPSWSERVPAVGSLSDPAGVDAWRRAAGPAEVDAVLRGLAELAARDGGDDTDAATVLAWLLLPTAIRLSAEFIDADPDIDEHIAACLWIEVRTFRWRTSSRVAANIAWRVRNQVLVEVGDRRQLADRGKRTQAHTLVDEALVRERAEQVASSDREDLLEVLDWAVEQALLSEADTGLLVDVVAAAARSTSGPPAGGWLLGDQASELVGAELGVSGRTVRRRAKRSIEALAEAIQRQAPSRSSAIRRIA
ncbi:MAG: hypothetical protein J0I14_01185 [Propionibacteriaceae bacterium]|jgi:hypothetical protein|nr:hypothetical protein [Propionibacteriaceae bacterium]